MLKELLGPDGPATITITIPMMSVTEVVTPPTYPMPLNGKPIANDADKEGKGSMYDVIDVAGRLCVRLDSPQSQSNRMEQMLKGRHDLIPQIKIKTNRSLLHIADLGHRISDAFLMCTDFAETAQQAIDAYRSGNAYNLAKVAPTSLIFGFWDSRRSGTKCSRVVISEITANDVSVNRKSAQFFATGNMPNDDSDEIVMELGLSDLSEDDLQQLGFKDVPSTNRLGGVFVRGGITRKIVISLETIRQMHSEHQNELQEYILGLSLLASLTPMPAMLRQGCILVPNKEPTVVGNYNNFDHPLPMKQLDITGAMAELWAIAAAQAFVVGGPRECKLCPKAAADWRAMILKKKDAKKAKKVK